MNMKMKSTIAGVVLALVAGVAHAGGGSLGVVSTTQSFGDSNITATLTDAFTFTVPTTNTYNFIGSTVISGLTPTSYNFDLTSFNLYNVTTSTLLGTGTITSSPVDLGQVKYNGMLSAADTYSVVVQGGPQTAGIVGSYGGSVSVTSAVPETGTLPLSVLGLGVVALIARRNKKTA